MKIKHGKKNILGTKDRPRLVVFKSLKHIYGQIVDDVSGKTIASASTVEKDLKPSGKVKKTEQAKKIGAALAERALAKKVEKVVFDRNGHIYHGRLKALADAAREKGLKF